MRKIIDKINKMNMFQKIQILSGLIPLYSFIFVFLVSYIIRWKAKGGYSQLIVFSILYFVTVCSCWQLNVHFLLKYIICCPISIVGNYLLVSTNTEV